MHIMMSWSLYWLEVRNKKNLVIDLTERMTMLGLFFCELRLVEEGIHRGLSIRISWGFPAQARHYGPPRPRLFLNHHAHCPKPMKPHQWSFHQKFSLKTEIFLFVIQLNYIAKHMPFSAARPCTYTPLTRQTVKQLALSTSHPRSKPSCPQLPGNIVENSRTEISSTTELQLREYISRDHSPLHKMHSLPETTIDSMLLTEEEALEEMVDQWHLDESFHTC